MYDFSIIQLTRKEYAGVLGDGKKYNMMGKYTLNKTLKLGQPNYFRWNLERVSSKFFRIDYF